MNATQAAAILADLRARFGDDAFVRLCVHAARDDMRSYEEGGNKPAELDAEDIRDWADGLVDSMLYAQFGA